MKLKKKNVPLVFSRHLRFRTQFIYVIHQPPAGRYILGNKTKIWFRSDEGLTLETSAFQIFHGGNSTFINSSDKTKFFF